MDSKEIKNFSPYERCQDIETGPGFSRPVPTLVLEPFAPSRFEIFNFGKKFLEYLKIVVTKILCI